MATDWPLGRRIAYGADYNPEHWTQDVRDEDLVLMREAGVTTVTIGMWDWALLEPREGEYDFGWLDRLLDDLHAAGIDVDLGTPSAAPPAWFYATYPEARVITREGVPLGPGSRGAAAPTSPQYRDACVRIASRLAERYADHPAVVLWHVHNEYGAPVCEDFSPHALVAFRAWLADRYGDLDGLNAAWGTTFWGQVYRTWDEVGLPGPTATVGNPSQQLDFARFSEHALRECYILERDAIRARASQPVTTNFMANECPAIDMHAWAPEVDIVSNDHYLTAADVDGHIGLALAADLTRSVGGGAPWILMEHSTSAVNWQPRNVAKRPGEMARNSLAHVARGADAVMFFQWRASRFGAEKFHSAMVPHAGTSSRVFREVVELGRDLARLGEMQGTTVRSDVALLWDQQSHWAQGLEWRPSVDMDAKERTRTWYERLWRDHLTTDLVRPTDDLARYRLVVAPASYLLTEQAAANLTAYVAGGGTLVVAGFAAAVDETDTVHAGGYLAPLRTVLGVHVEEYLPLREGATAEVEWAPAGEWPTTLTNRVWQEHVVLDGAEVVATFASGPGAGLPAVTRHEHGAGAAWYVPAFLDVDGLAPVLVAAYADAGIVPPALPEGVEAVTRVGDGVEYTVLLNHTDSDVEVPVADAGAVHELLADLPVDGTVHLAAGGRAVLRATVPTPDPFG